MARIAAAALAATASTAAAFTLTGDAVFVIPGDDNSPALSLAFRDLQRDYYKTLGVVPVIVSSLPAPKSLPADTVLVLLGDASAYPGFSTSDCTSGWESHCVLRHHPRHGHRRARRHLRRVLLFRARAGRAPDVALH